MSDALDIDVLAESPLWRNQPAAEPMICRAIGAAAAEIPAAGEIAVLLTDDDTIRKLNKDWRGIDEPTNVLSFPGQAPQKLRHLGDIVLAYETLARECEREKRDFLHHLAHLSVHGFLHLMGYDHRNDSEANAMERLESAILGKLDVPDPYAERDMGKG